MLLTESRLRKIIAEEYRLMMQEVGADTAAVYQVGGGGSDERHGRLKPTDFNLFFDTAKKYVGDMKKGGLNEKGKETEVKAFLEKNNIKEPYEYNALIRNTIMNEPLYTTLNKLKDDKFGAGKY